MKDIYFDNSATTKACNSAIDGVIYTLRENYGNPSSLHIKGIEAEKAMDEARSIIAGTLGCNKNEIYFTSGGTESNNTAIFGSVYQGKKALKKVITTAIEHSSVLGAMDQLEKEGFEVVYLKPDRYGKIDIEQIKKAVDKNTVLVSMMMVNNEVGSILPVHLVKDIIKSKGSKALLHVDAVQAYGKIPVKVKDMGIDLLSISSHKIHGPKGVGALFISAGVKISPILFGGGQEKGISPGTEAVPQIVGFGRAAAEFSLGSDDYNRILELNGYLRNRASRINDVEINSPDDGSPYIINLCVKGIKSEVMTRYLSSHGIYVSSGSACSKGKPSHVLTAMGIPKKLIDSSIRISFSRYNTRGDIEEFLKWLQEGINTLVKFEGTSENEGSNTHKNGRNSS